MKNFILIILTLTFTSQVSAQNGKDLNIRHMLRGSIYAYTSIVDSNALGGYGGSSNFAKSINDLNSFTQTGFFMVLDTSETITWAEKYNGYHLYIVNKSDSIVTLNASDSRLYIVAEVFYKNEWKPIEYLTSSWCGNSYHHVLLKSNEYWQFNIPKFTGKIKTKIRYRLTTQQDGYIYSNEIEASFNKKQLTNKNEYTPKGLMDPYND